MATKEHEESDEASVAPEEADEQRSDSEPATANAEPTANEEEQGSTAVQMGGQRYVHAAFFVAGILIAYLGAKLVYAAWNRLAEWPAAVRAVPQLLRYAEDERESITMVAGAVIGVAAVIQTYRKEHIRRWADEVAFELTKVTWPNREAVTNGTIVVLIASAIFTVYVAVLDRFWSFLTTLVYGV